MRQLYSLTTTFSELYRVLVIYTYYQCVFSTILHNTLIHQHFRQLYMIKIFCDRSLLLYYRTLIKLNLQSYSELISPSQFLQFIHTHGFSLPYPYCLGNASVAMTIHATNRTTTVLEYMLLTSKHKLVHTYIIFILFFVALYM